MTPQPPHTASTADLNVRQAGPVTVVDFKDRRLVDGVQIQRIGEQLETLVATTAPPRIVVDFSRVEYLSSAAIGVLLTLDKAVKARKGRLALCGVSAELMKLFALLKLHKLATMHDTIDAATQDVRG
jgi:anti-sigma B factor antagonist